jgi:hypothetical protein
MHDADMPTTCRLDDEGAKRQDPLAPSITNRQTAFWYVRKVRVDSHTAATAAGPSSARALSRTPSRTASRTPANSASAVSSSWASTGPSHGEDFGAWPTRMRHAAETPRL